MAVTASATRTDRSTDRNTNGPGRLKHAPAPLEPDSDFDNDDTLATPDPPSKRRKLTHNKRTLAPTQNSSRNFAGEESDGNVSDPINKTRDVHTGCVAPNDSSSEESDGEKLQQPQSVTLFELLGVKSAVYADPFHEDGIGDDWFESEADEAQASKDAPLEDGDETETETETEAGDETETEDEDDNDPLSKRNRGQKPNIVARADQIATGKFVLRRPIASSGKPSSSSQSSNYEVHSIPSSINTFLRDYQRDGVQFFYERYCENRGGILGDDMGLGKTIQVIAFLAAIMHKENDLRDVERRYKHVQRLQEEVTNSRHLPPANATWPTALIIVPVTVMGNWERELETWGYFEVGSYTGTKLTRENVLKDFKLGRLDIVLASFEVVRDHIDEFDDLAWSCIFLDEAHKIKNKDASITKAHNRFTCQVRFGLTGTAMQNNYKELWPLLSWSNSGRLGTHKEWKYAITKPLTRGQSHSATEEERKLAVVVAKGLVDKLLPQFFKRRTKALIKDQLPSKYDEVVFCPLTPLQLEVYKRFLSSEDVQLIVYKDELCDCDSGELRKKCCYETNSEGVPWRALVLKYISILIKISNHLMLLYPGEGDSPEQKARNKEYLKIAFPDEAEMRHPSASMKPGMCGKWLVLETLLTQWKQENSDNKVLIFSKSVKLLEFLELELAKKFGRNRMCYLDGKTKKEDRMTIVDKFNTDPEVFVFLISTTAGGTGLNLTSANKVVIFDPNWNPAHDLQAMDRAYRYGQVRDVYVYRLLGAGSLEELIYARQIYKQQQMQTAYEGKAQTRFFEGVQDDKDRQGELFGIRNIFTLHESAYSTKFTIERALVKELEWALLNAPADAKKLKDEEDELRGLGALMVDDDALGTVQAKLPETKETESDVISALLRQTGVKYRHRNDEVIKPTRIASQSARAVAKRGRRTFTIDSGAATSVVPHVSDDWPPKRKKHVNSKILPKPAMTPEEMQLAKKKQKLLNGGYIVDFDEDYNKFAVKFGKMKGSQQRALLRELDQIEED